jgi:hypothetical protein
VKKITFLTNKTQNKKIEKIKLQTQIQKNWNKNENHRHSTSKSSPYNVLILVVGLLGSDLEQ